jgi:hypothetical protein
LLQAAAASVTDTDVYAFDGEFFGSTPGGKALTRAKQSGPAYAGVRVKWL